MDETYNGGFDLKMPSANMGQGNSNLDQLKNAVSASTPASVKAKSGAPKMEVIFPNHLFIPAGAVSIDARKVMNIPSPTIDYEIFRFVAPQGSATRFIAYGVFNDGNDASFYRFHPTIDGARIMPYHGDPMNNFKIDLGLGPDLSNSVMIPCQIAMMPGQTLQWFVTNTSGVDTSMGVRMMGYFDTQQIRVTPRFG